MTGSAVSGKRRFDKRALTIEEQLDLLKKRGLMVGDEERAKWAEATAGVYEQFEERIGKDLIEEVKATVKGK